MTAKPTAKGWSRPTQNGRRSGVPAAASAGAEVTSAEASFAGAAVAGGVGLSSLMVTL
ncbi:hypothetical protein [Microbacterium schleiferi]|uniref:hypothetical protein n=1 Tax=Microbacterium schleiferi TaxID=69362 RepID=UPI001E4635ED|nr:hypothetical protein [Microbacterium schleiferi]